MNILYIARSAGFETGNAALEFLVKHGCNSEEHFEEKDHSIYLKTDKAFPIVQAAKSAAFGTVDIKGQL